MQENDKKKKRGPAFRKMEDPSKFVIWCDQQGKLMDPGVGGLGETFQSGIPEEVRALHKRYWKKTWVSTRTVTIDGEAGICFFWGFPTSECPDPKYITDCLSGHLPDKGTWYFDAFETPSMHSLKWFLTGKDLAEDPSMLDLDTEKVFQMCEVPFPNYELSARWSEEDPEHSFFCRGITPWAYEMYRVSRYRSHGTCQYGVSHAIITADAIDKAKAAKANGCKTEEEVYQKYGKAARKYMAQAHFLLQVKAGCYRISDKWMKKDEAKHLLYALIGKDSDADYLVYKDSIVEKYKAAEAT